MEVYTKLLSLEKEIEELYLYLVTLEISEQKHSHPYRLVMERINNLTKQESSLLIDAQGDDHIQEVMNHYSLRELPINLGHHTQVSEMRLHYLLQSVSGDVGMEYAYALKYDINRILLKFLECMIDNPYYEDIRNKLIYFKYDIIFLDYNVENDFLLENDYTRVSLDSRAYQENLPSHKYIDQAILIWESEEAMKQVMVASNVNGQTSSYIFVVIQAMQILARMALCTEEQLNYVMDDFHYLMESESIHSKTKEIIMELFEIFKEIQTSFYFSR